MNASAPTLGAMALAPSLLPPVTPTSEILPDGRPTPEFRERLRRIPSIRNAVSVVALWAQCAAVLAVVAHRPSPATWILGFLLMGRTHAQVASLMHEAAHRLLFANKSANDFVGRWFLGYTQLTSTAAYRRVHMAHHRHEFGPDEPDIALYANYPVGSASLRRKLVRDATGRTGAKLLTRQFAALGRADRRVRRTMAGMLAVQLVLLGACIASGHWYLYPVFWVAPYLTVWRVINRLRSIAEHGGLRADSDRRITTHAVVQHPLARFFIVPYNIGFHLAHHVDAGIPFRALPGYHAALRRAGYLDARVEWPNYRTLWRALAGPPRPAG